MLVLTQWLEQAEEKIQHYKEYNETLSPDIIAGIETIGESSEDIERRGSLTDVCWRKLHNLGVFRLTIPKRHGGLEADCITFARVIEALSKVNLSLSITAVPHLCNAVGSISRFADDKLQKIVFKDCIENNKLISFALTEDNTGSDVAAHRSSVSIEDDRQLVLNGSKLWTTNVLNCAYIIVVAKANDFTPIPNGSVFLLIKPNEKGLIVTKEWRKLGGNGSHSVSLFFDNVRLPTTRLFGDPGRAMQQFNQVVLKGRLGAAAGGLGLLRAAKEACTADLPKSLVDAYETHLLLMTSVVEITAYVMDRFIERRQRDGSIDIAGELTALVALCKYFCTELGTTSIKELFLYCVEYSTQVHPDLRQALIDVPVLRVIEGPNEVLCHFGILTMISKIIAIDNSLAQVETDSLSEATKNNYREVFAALTTLRQEKRFSQKQVKLSRICSWLCSCYAKECLTLYAAKWLVEEQRVESANQWLDETIEQHKAWFNGADEESALMELIGWTRLAA